MTKTRHLLLAGVLAIAPVVGLAPASAEPSAQPAAGQHIDLTTPGEGTTNVTTTNAVRLGSAANRAADTRQRIGFAVYPLRLDTPANTFAATVRSTVPAGAELAVDVRGRLDGQWTEWTEIGQDAPAVLPAAARDVQVRAALTATGTSPELRALTVTPSTSTRSPSGSVHATDAGLSYEVFATREGLVGGTTANGHVIVSRDHFVALPSRRGLSDNNAGDYSVRVCAANGRCEWAPT